MKKDVIEIGGAGDSNGHYHPGNVRHGEVEASDEREYRGVARRLPDDVG